MAGGRSIIVAGGGIAGLTCALTLASRGYRVDVFERAAKFDPVGAGIQLSPNAVSVLDRLGLSVPLRRAAAAAQGIKVLSARSAKTITTIPLGVNAIASYGLPYLTIHRADLHSVLEDACRQEPDIALHNASEVIDVTHHANGVSVLVQSARGIITRKGLCFVAADGVNSRHRTETFGEPSAVHSGFVAWRGMLHADDLPALIEKSHTTLVLGSGSHGIFYPVRAGNRINVLLALPDPESNRQPVANASKAGLGILQKQWHPGFLDCLAMVENWSTWPLLHHPSTGRWHEGPAVMIGDAAHAMLPFAAQGAAMAIEDAHVLADCMETSKSPEAAFKAFSRSRRKRVRRVAELAKQNGHIYHLGWPFSVIRNIGMRLVGGKSLLKRQDWIYRWNAD